MKLRDREMETGSNTTEHSHVLNPRALCELQDKINIIYVQLEEDNKMDVKLEPLQVFQFSTDLLFKIHIVSKL